MPKYAIIESPYAGTDWEVKRNTVYAQLLCRYAVQQGLNPFASHLFYTGFMLDKNPVERELGINLGLQLSTYIAQEDAICLVGTDFGLSAGVNRAIEKWTGIIPIHQISLLSNETISKFFAVCKQHHTYPLKQKLIVFDSILEHLQTKQEATCK